MVLDTHNKVFLCQDNNNLVTIYNYNTTKVVFNDKINMKGATLNPTEGYILGYSNKIYQFNVTHGLVKEFPTSHLQDIIDIQVYD